MTVAELINILSDRYPTENITIRNESGRYLTIDGIDEAQSMATGCIVLKAAWTYSDKPVESEEDKLKRQREEINKQLAKMRSDEAKAKAKAEKKKTTKRKKKRKKNATAAEQIAKGVVPTGKRGRPRKMVEDTEYVLDFATANDLDGLAKKVAKSAVHSPQTNDNETDNSLE